MMSDHLATDRTLVREHLFLLAHDEDRKCRLRIHQPALGIGLAGAALIDLLIADRIHLANGRIYLTDLYDRTSILDPINDHVLGTIRRVRSAVPVVELIKKLAPEMYERTCGSLIADGVLDQTARWGRRQLALRTSGTVVRIRSKLRQRADGRGAADLPTDALCALISALNLHECMLFWRSRAELEPRLQSVVEEIPFLAARGSPVAAIPHIAQAVRHAVGDLGTAAL